MKSVRLRIAANLVMILGLLSAFLGSGAYCVICMPEVLNIPFHWEYLALVGIATLLILILSIVLHVAANRAKALEQAETDEDSDISDDTTEYEKLEAEIAQEQTESAEDAVLLPEQSTQKKKKPLSKKAAKTIAITSGILIPIVAAGVTALVLIRAKKKKQAKKKRDAEVPKIYVWIK